MKSHQVDESSSTAPMLKPSEMFDFAFDRINAAMHSAANHAVIPPTAGSVVYGVRFTANDQNIVLTSPACDDTGTNARNLGTSPLPDVLTLVSALQKKNADEIYLIPLAECQPMLRGWTHRQHWTMLMIQNKECHFFDPCSATWWPSSISASCLYSLQPLKDILNKQGYALSNANMTYLGWQLDSVNCGRFCSAIAEKAAVTLLSGKNAAAVSLFLQDIKQNPNIDALVAESKNCNTNDQIKSIRSAINNPAFLRNSVLVDAVDSGSSDDEKEDISLALEQYEAFKLRIDSDMAVILAKNVMELFCNNTPEEASRLLASASREVLNQALVIVSVNGDTPLGMAAGRQSPEAFKALVEKASVDAIDKALVIVNKVGFTPLIFAAFKQSLEAFKALVEKASVHAIDKAIVIVSNDRLTPLILAAGKQSPEAFKALVEKASVDAIDKALVIVSVTGDTPLSMAATIQSPEAFKVLVEKATLAAVSQACLKLDEDKKSVLDLALGRFSPDVVACLLQKVDDNALDFLLKRPEVPQNILSTIAKYITHEPSWQNPILLQKIFKSVGASLIDPFICAWIAGNEIPLTVIEQMKPALTLKKEGNSSSSMKTVVDGLLMMTAEELQEKKDERFISTRFNKIIKIKDLNENMLKVIWEEGLKSAIDYHYIKHLLPNSIAAQMVDDLFRAERLFVGCVVPFNVERYQEHKDFLWLAKNNHLACKIIKEENWGDFVAQLKDYQQHRPALRKKIDKTAITHKFLHRTGGIIQYQLHEKVSKKKDYTHTKKQSATLLSENLNTTVFGQHDPDRQLVGVLADISCHFVRGVSAPKDNELTVNAYFLYQENNGWQLIYVDDDKRRMPIDIKSVQGLTESLNLEEKDNSMIEAHVAAYHNARIIKAMLCYDRGTFDRKWVGNQEGVEKYANEMQRHNFTDFDAFRKWANEKPYQVNEILMKFSRGSLLAIVIAADTLEARKIAMERHQNILSTFNLDLPIVFYANTFKQMPIYTLAQQADDDVGKNNLLEVDCQIRLNAIIDMILKNSLTVNVKPLSLFGATPAENILNWIEKMNGGECLPSMAFMKINALIDQETKVGNDKQFYLELQKVIDGPCANSQTSQSADQLLRTL